MTASYLTTDIIVIIVLVVVLVLIGLCAFLIHYYWTKIGVSEMWNTVKWSSMRSSFYRTVNHFRRKTNSKYADEESLSHISVQSDEIDRVSVQKKKSSPMITSYYTPTNASFVNNNYNNKPVSAIAYDRPARQNHGRKISQSIDSTKMNNSQQNNSRYNDLATIIQSQRF